MTPLTLPAAVIVDRDGVLNQDSDAYIKTPDEWQPIPSSFKAISHLNKAGILVGMASNQGGVARGLITLDAHHAIHAKLESTLSKAHAHLDAYRYCIEKARTHPDYKPNPGMLNALKQIWQLPESALVYFVGDKSSDAMAALNSGCVPILVKTGKPLEDTWIEQQTIKIAVYQNLATFVEDLLQA